MKATRNGGNRNIDFGLGNLFALERGQCPGPRDHDLVWYGFPATRVPCFAQPKFRSIVSPKDKPSDVDLFFDIWARQQEIFAAAKVDQNVDMMWRCLSDAAEDFLGGASQGLRRSSSWQPQRARVGKHKAELRVPQSLAKLLRTVRMMHELAKNHSDRLAFKVHQRVLDHSGPEATPPKWSILDALPSMSQELQDAQDRFRVEQLQKWQAAMADDPARQRKWIQAATAVDPEQRLPHVTVQTAVHPQDKLAEAANFWSNFWQTQPDSCATFEETMSGKRGQLLSFLNWVPPGF